MWTIEERNAWRPCPAHADDPERKCIVCEYDEHDACIRVKLHGRFMLGDNGEPRVFGDLKLAENAADDLMSSIPAFNGQEPVTRPDNPKPEPGVVQVKHEHKNAYAYNMFQVMLQGVPGGSWVLVNAPRFGPLEPNAAINLAAWLRRYAEECGGLRMSFDEVWETVKDV